MPKKQPPRRIDECDNAPANFPFLVIVYECLSQHDAQPHTAKMQSHARTQITQEKEEEANSMSCELMCGFCNAKDNKQKRMLCAV
jgi:hypothetical protein